MQLKSLATVTGAATLVAIGALTNVKPASAAPADGILNFAGNVSFTNNSFTFLDTPVVAPTSTGTFASFLGAPVTIQNITPGATDLPAFVTVDGYDFNLQGFSQSNIALGTSPNGQTTATVAANGTWVGGGGTSIGAGTFTAQVTSPTTYSASITAIPNAVVPEPSETLGTVALGVVGGGMWILRNRKRQAANA